MIIMLLILSLSWESGLAYGADKGAGNGADIAALNQAEVLYIQQHAAVMVYDPAWPPFDYRDSGGNHAGIAADLLRLISAKTGLLIEPKYTASWAGTMELVHSGQFDIVSMLNITESRRDIMNFTTPLLVEPLVLVAKAGSGSMDMDSLSGKLAVVDGYVVEEFVARDHPEATLAHALTTEDSLRMVKDGTVQATIMTGIEAKHLIRKNSWNDLVIVGKTDYAYSLSIGVRKDDALLLSILQKGVDAMSSAEKEKILSKWLSDPEITDRKDFSHWQFVGIALLALILGALIYRMAVTPRKQ